MTPKYRYFLKVQKGNGPVMTWNGKSFTNRPDDQPHAFSRADAAKDKGKALTKAFPILAQYRVFVEPKFYVAAGATQKARAMRTGRKLNPAWVKDHKGEWTTSDGYGVLRVTHSRKSKKWYLFRETFGNKPVLMGEFDSKLEAQKAAGLKKNPIKRTPNVESELDEAAKRLEDFSGHPVQHLESAYSRSDQKTGLIVGELDLIGYRAKRDGKVERYGHHFKKNSRPLLAVTSDGKQLHIVGGQYEFTEAGIEDR